MVYDTVAALSAAQDGGIPASFSFILYSGRKWRRVVRLSYTACDEIHQNKRRFCYFVCLLLFFKLSESIFFSFVSLLKMLLQYANPPSPSPSLSLSFHSTCQPTPSGLFVDTDATMGTKGLPMPPIMSLTQSPVAALWGYPMWASLHWPKPP